MLEKGATAPEFEAESSKGGLLKLSKMRGKKVVLYFFPKSFTSGCTRETHEFASAYPKLSGQGTEVIGVSVDTVDTQAKFANECGAGFPIIADPTKVIAKSYGVMSRFGVARRVTFLIDEQGRVQEVVESMLPSPHVERAVAWAGLAP